MPAFGAPGPRHAPTSQTVTGTTKSTPSFIVEEYFKSLDDIPVTISDKDDQLGDKEKTALSWLTENVSRGKESENEKRFVISKSSLDSAGGDILKRHNAKKFPPLTADKAYVQVRYLRNGVTTEYHGVIDPEGPQLLSFWKETP